MAGWARVAWLVGLGAVLALAWERRRWRRVDTGAPGSRVARNQHLYEVANGWPLMALTGLLTIANGAGIAGRDPTGREGTLGRTGVVLGAIGAAVAVLVALLGAGSGPAARGRGQAGTGSSTSTSSRTWGRGSPRRPAGHG